MKDGTSIAAIVSRNLDAMSDRRTLKRYILVLATVNLLVWLSVIMFPHDVSDAWVKVTDLNDKIGAIVLAVIFAIGMWLTYSILRLRFPDVEDQEFGAEVLPAYPIIHERIGVFLFG